MNINNPVTSEVLAYQAKGAKWFVVAAYDHMGHQKGDVLSWHKTDKMMVRASRGQFCTHISVSDVLDNARYIDAAVTREA